MSVFEEQPTAHGVRLLQHGATLSELRTAPGPTHSIFDVLAATIIAASPGPEVLILGFAAGGLVAPLRALEGNHQLTGIDLDPAGHDLFRRHARQYAGPVAWEQAEAGTWLRSNKTRFDFILEDLSEPRRGDVFKPALCFNSLPMLVHRNLQPLGTALFNLFLDRQSGETWRHHLPLIFEPWQQAIAIHFEDFENRFLLVSDRSLSTARIGFCIRDHLQRLNSDLAGRIRLRRMK